VRGRLEAHHRVAHGQDGAHGVGHLVEVGRRDGHVVGQVVAQAGLGAQVAEHLHEPLPEGVQLGLAPRADGAAAAAHQRVDVRREAHPGQPQPAVVPGDEGAQVRGVEVAVGHRHRRAAVPAHRQQRLGVVVGGQQADLAADQLGVRVGAAAFAQVGHLRVDLADGVPAVDADLVGVGRVVAGGAGQVAPREDAVGALAAHRVPAEALRRGAHVLGQGGPPLGQRPLGLRVHRPGPLRQPPPPRPPAPDRSLRHDRHPHRWCPVRQLRVVPGRGVTPGTAG
jgi:hypothetical protein